MKKAILLFAIFLLIIGAGIGEHYYVHSVFDDFNDRLETLEDLVDNENAEDAIESVVQMEEWWLKKKHTLEMISYCADIRQVNVVIGEIQGSLEREDFDNASSKIDSLYQLLDNIRDILDFNAADII